MYVSMNAMRICFIIYKKNHSVYVYLHYANMNKNYVKFDFSKYLI